MMNGSVDFGKDGVAPRRSEDRLLLDEAHHRTSNEIAAALAALCLIKSAKRSRNRWHLLTAAIDRLEGFANVHALLGKPMRPMVELGTELEALCRAVLAARYTCENAQVALRLPALKVDGSTARTVMLICAELVANAVRHALTDRGGLLEIELERFGDQVLLKVCDDGPGMASSSGTSGTGFGGALVTELVRYASGTIECDTGPHGTSFLVAIPFDPTLLASVRE